MIISNITKEKECPEMDMKISDSLFEYSLVKKGCESVIEKGKEGRSKMKNVIGKVCFDLKKGFDSGQQYKIHHGVHYLYEVFEMEKFAQHLKPRESESLVRFVCGRYILTAIDDALWSHFKHFELIALRRKNMIYIGLNRDLEARVPNSSQLLGLYCGLNFARYMTHANFLTSDGFENTHSTIRNVVLFNKNTGKEIQILLSSTIRAYQSGHPIELHTQFESKENKMTGPKARQWWWRSKLSGCQKVVYGNRDEDYIVREVKEMSIDELTKPFWKFKPSATAKLVHKVFEGIESHLHNDGDLCSVTFKGNDCIKIEKCGSEVLNRSTDW